MKPDFKGGFRRRLKGLLLNRVHSMITCREFEDFILQYLDNELSQKQHSMFEWHIRLCRECREYLAAYQQTLKLAKSVVSNPEASVPEKVPEDLIKAILASRESLE